MNIKVRPAKNKSCQKRIITIGAWIWNWVNYWNFNPAVELQSTMKLSFTQCTFHATITNIKGKRREQKLRNGKEIMKKKKGNTKKCFCWHLIKLSLPLLLKVIALEISFVWKHKQANLWPWFTISFKYVRLLEHCIHFE